MEANNVKAMREALEKIQRLATSDRPADEVEIANICRAALSAPPRNCDRLSADQCKKMFEHEMGIYFPKEATDRDREIARCTAYGVIDALYAERKGESDGSK